MKSLILVMIASLLLPGLLKAQWYENLRDVGPPLNPIQATQHYVRNTGSGGVPLRLMWTVRDTCWFRIYTDSVVINYLANANHANPSKLMWADSIGMLKATPLSGFYFADTTNVVSTQNWVTNRGYLTSETDPLFNTKFAGKSTTDLIEGTNLYYTTTRFNNAFASKTTTDLSEGTNLYYTIARFNTAFAGKTTTDLNEGTNLYWTQARFNTAFAAKSTTDLVEGTNQYFTNSRARSALSAGTGISYNNTTGVITNSSPDQTVTIASGTGMSVTGTYPSFTATNTAPDQTVTIGSGTGISVIGSYPSFTVTNTAPVLTPTFTTPSRAISTTGTNNTFTVSATRPSFVAYTINIAFALTILTSNGQVDLEYSTNAGSTWVPVSSTSNAYTVAVTLTGNSTGVVCGYIPANALVRINRSANSNVTITLTKQLEVTF